MRAILTFLALIVGFSWLAAGASQAETWFEALVMPGKLATAHAKLESKCENCHGSFAQDTQPKLCLNCHETVAADVATGAGFHGRAPEARALSCSSCHDDHQGRDFNMVPLDAETFDHSWTDFSLVGAHTAASCESCHLTGKKFAEAPSACVDCHKLNDPHKGALGTDCSSCHVGTRWDEVKAFDHSKTKFPLVGSHVTLNCDSCHAAEVWTGLPIDCIGCHMIDDVHENRFGADCATCHESGDWAKVRFEHDRDTDFALTGKHLETDCTGCHLPGGDAAKTTTDCIGCHQADDVHKSTLGEDCASCHGTESWVQEVVFDHDLTQMPLLGLHAIVPCEGCHNSKAFSEVDIACVSCHIGDDVHKAALDTDCATCHNPNGWVFWRFDHGTQTDFLLTGAHNGLVCEACHTPGTVATDVPVACAECHQKEDIHKGTFGANCEACHGTDTFKGAQLRLPATP